MSALEEVVASVHESLAPYAIAAGRGEDLSTDEKLGEFVEWGVRTAGIHFLAAHEWPGEITP